jgi:thioredoxin domain-containing protein 5
MFTLWLVLSLSCFCFVFCLLVLWTRNSYAPWCGHCKRMAPIWDEFATQVKDSPLNVAKVDCTEHASVCQAAGVRGYPTLKLYQAGQPTPFKGARTLESFTEFVNSNAPAAIEGGAAAAVEEEEVEEAAPAAAAAAPSAGEVSVLGEDSFEEAIKEGRWLIKFYAPWCGHCKRLVPTWDSLAKSADGFGVAKVDCTEHRDLCGKYSVRGYPTIKLFVDGEHAEDYRGARDEASLAKFASA